MKIISFTEMFHHLEGLKSKENYLISIVIPVYNEEETIYSLLTSLPDNNYFEIVVVDDASIDNSLNEIKKAQETHNIKLFKHRKNRGYGKALLTGISRAKGNIIVTMDSDGQHRVEDIYNLIKPILDGDTDYTIGSRYLGSYYYKLAIATRLGEILVEILIRLFFGIKVVNNQGGFRAFHRKVLPIFDDIQYQNYAFTTEIIVRAAIYGFKIKECPIKLMDRTVGKSRIILNKLAINLFILIFRYLLLKIKMRIFRQNKIIFKKKKLIFREL